MAFAGLVTDKGYELTQSGDYILSLSDKVKWSYNRTSLKSGYTLYNVYLKFDDEIQITKSKISYPEGTSDPQNNFYCLKKIIPDVSSNEIKFKYIVPNSISKNFETHLNNLIKGDKRKFLIIKKNGSFYLAEASEVLRTSHDKLKHSDLLEDIDAINNYPTLNRDKINQSKDRFERQKDNQEKYIDIHKIVYGDKEKKEKIKLIFTPKQDSGINSLLIDSVDEKVLRKNGTVSHINNFLRCQYLSKDSNNFEIFKDIKSGSEAYGILLARVLDRVMITNQKMISINPKESVLTLLGNPSIDDISSFINYIIKTKGYSQYSVDSTTRHGIWNFQMGEPVIYDKPVNEHYYEDIDGIILPNQEGKNIVPDMVNIFHEILKDQ